MKIWLSKIAKRWKCKGDRWKYSKGHQTVQNRIRVVCLGHESGRDWELTLI